MYAQARVRISIADIVKNKYVRKVDLVKIYPNIFGLTTPSQNENR